jgi:uncharacterized protein YecE (DUF72 family)
MHIRGGVSPTISRSTIQCVTILVGTSGWQYHDWRDRFYPQDLPQRSWLRYFSERFPVVEVNNTFYNLPKEETFVAWREGSAPGFLIGVKASRYITHIRRLRDPREPVELLWSRCRLLKTKLGPVLFQLPPNFPCDLERLEGALGVLPRGMRAAFEFRHPSWETQEVRRLLDGAGCALVLADRPGARVPGVVTGGWSYVRFHEGGPSGPDYPRDKLRRWAEKIARLEARDVYLFFNNDTGGAAIRDARTLTELLADRGLEVRGPRPDDGEGDSG